MKKYSILLALLILHLLEASAQNNLKIIINDASTRLPLTGASVQLKDLDIGGLTDLDGKIELSNIPDGLRTFIISFIGFEKEELNVTFPLNNQQPILVWLENSDKELEEVVITTTRSSRSIQHIPTRVEFIGGEELDEKITMQPGNIRLVLSESTGIQTQQTSVSSANATIRIQGLDGRYTQILKDGFPLYAGFSGGLSIMQIPPLDLKQVDVIKGSASTLYGGGAIAGLINLISKQPTEERELSLLVNGTSALGLDVSSYYSQKFNKFGITLFASSNHSKAYDPADIGLSAIPQYNRYTFNPRAFFYINESTSLIIGLNTSFEDRLGGDMKVITGDADATHQFFEKNKTDRISTQLAFNKKFQNKATLSVKNSFNIFNRDIEQFNYFFGGQQQSTFSEINYTQFGTTSDWVIGVNLWTDQFQEDKQGSVDARDYQNTTSGVFAQHTLTANDWLSIESGLRIDYASTYSNSKQKLKDPFVLPRISLLFQLTPKLSSRMGGGLGYKTPTPFIEKAEEQVFRNVRPIDFSAIQSEKSYGMNADLNYQTNIGENWTISINQLFFYTKLTDPLVFNKDSLNTGVYYFNNANGHIDAIGTESNLKISYKDFKLFFGYTFVDAENHFDNTKNLIPLTAKHRINSVLLYEVHEKWRLGFEAFYFSPQQLSTGVQTKEYWIAGFSAQRNWEHLSLFINFENFTDTRQTRFSPIYSGTITNPQFSEIYAPLDGFVSNLGLILKL